MQTWPGKQIEQLQVQLRNSLKVNEQLKQSIDTAEQQLDLVRRNLSQCQITNRELLHSKSMHTLYQAHQDRVGVDAASLMSHVATATSKNQYWQQQHTAQTDKLDARVKELERELIDTRAKKAWFQKEFVKQKTEAQLLFTSNKELKSEVVSYQERILQMDSSLILVEQQRI